MKLTTIILKCNNPKKLQQANESAAVFRITMFILFSFILYKLLRNCFLNEHIVIMKKGGMFLDVESGEYYTVTDYPYLDISAYDNEKHDHVVWDEYTVNDLNHDGINDVICNLSDEWVNSFHLILAVVENEVCAYRVTFRGMNPLLKDGRIGGSSGADDNDFYCIVSFSRDGYSEKTLAKEDDGYYEIDGEPVTEEDWILYCKEFISSEKAVWQPFSNLSNQ